MDVNGTRFHLLLGEADWTRWAVAPDPAGSVDYDREREELCLARHPFRFRARPAERPPTLDDRRGVAADAFGNVYWIDDARRAVRVRSLGTGTASVFWAPGAAPAGPPAPPGFTPLDPPAAPPVALLAGLAVTEDHRLVVGTVEPPGLVVFDLHAPPVPRWLCWPDDVGFAPFDLCARAGGGLFVLDRARTRLWELDARLSVVSRAPGGDAAPPLAFTPVGPAAPAPATHPWRSRPRAADARDLGGDPTAIEPGPDGTLLVLDRYAEHPPSVVRLLHPDRPGEVLATLTGGPDGDPVEVVAHDIALAGPTLYAVDREGNQAYAFTLTADPFALELVAEYLPMRLFGGKGLVVTGDRTLYDIADTWVPLVVQGAPSHAPHATVVTAPFDGHVPGTVWHRLMIDGCIPPGTGVAVRSRAADELPDLALAGWQAEPPLTYRRSTGSELPFLAEPRPGHGTWEVLFQRATGRHLQLELTLTGDRRVTPRLAALRASYPRPSWLARLPHAYAEDPASASFLDRFLANTEGIATGIEDRIAAAQVLLDPRCAPDDALDWLLGWFDMAADPAWDAGRRRLFLTHAAEFFAVRGTVAGLERALRFALDPCLDEETWTAPGPARVQEAFRTRVVPALRGPAPASRWVPAQGGAVLRERWRAATGRADLPPFDQDPVWREFVRGALGADPPASLPGGAWTAFLTGRYRTVDALAAAYGLVGAQRPASLDAVGFPEELPPDGAALRDWYEFVVVALPTRAAAHRFSVLLPMPLGSAAAGPTPAERKAVAERVVAVQKPAHTVVDVLFFWAACQLGQARLGTDTTLGLGGRDPALHPALVLGRDHAGESHLGGPTRRAR